MTMEKKTRMGRPKSDNPATEKLPMIRVTGDQLKAYKAASERQGLTFSAWVRESLDKATK